MNASECLNLNNFVPALEQLCALSEDGNADPQELVSEASSLCTGIAASALFPSPADPACEWEGYLDGDTLTLYSSTHQLIFTLMFNAMNSATISGPGPATWKIGLSEKGTHVSAVGADGTVYQDVLIDQSGAVTDPRDLQQSFAELKQEWDKIADTPDEALPEYTPDNLIEDFNMPGVPDIDDIPDLGSGPGDGSGSSDDSGDSGSAGSGEAGGGASDGSYSGDSSGGAFGDALGSAVKGAAAFGAAAVAGMAAKAVGRAVDKAVSGSGQAEKPARSEPKADNTRPAETASSSAKAASTGKFAAVPELVLEGESGQHRIVAFPCKIGRSKESDLSLDSSLISRNHARFNLKEGLVELEDLGSSNGTFVDEEKISAPVVLKKGMKLRFANLTLEVMSCPEPEPEPVAPDSMKTVAFNMADKIAQAQNKGPSAEKIEKKPSEPASAKPAPPAPPARSSAPPPLARVEPKSAKPGPGQAAKPRSGSNEASSAKKCGKCGVELLRDAKFCPDCGAPVKHEELSCICGCRYEPGDKFCPDCGRPLGASQAPAPAKPPAAPSPARPSRPARPEANVPPPPARSGSSAPPPPLKSGSSAPPPPVKSRPAPPAGKSHAPASPSQAELEKRRKEREEHEDNEFVKRVSSDEALEKTALPSVRWVSFLFLVVMGLDHASLVKAEGSAVIDDIAFQRGLGAGIATVFFAFIAGGSPGKFRLFTMVSAAVYLGNQLFRDFSLLSDIAQNPGMIQQNNELILPLASLLFAAWLVKRAARQS